MTSKPIIFWTIHLHQSKPTSKCFVIFACHCQAGRNIITQYIIFYFSHPPHPLQNFIIKQKLSKPVSHEHASYYNEKVMISFSIIFSILLVIKLIIFWIFFLPFCTGLGSAPLKSVCSIIFTAEWLGFSSSPWFLAQFHFGLRSNVNYSLEKDTVVWFETLKWRVACGCVGGFCFF